MLEITNLPSHVRPSHITHILSHVRVSDKDEGGGVIRRVDPGVSLVQIYTIPRRTAKRKRLASRLKVLVDPSSTFIQEEEKELSDKPESDIIQQDLPPPYSQFVEQQNGNDQSNARGHNVIQETTVQEAEVDLDDEDAEREDAVPTVVEEEQDEEMETIAYVHFRDEYFFWQAQELLKKVTVDGRKIGYKVKRWDSAPFRRFWRSLTGKTT